MLSSYDGQVDDDLAFCGRGYEACRPHESLNKAVCTGIRHVYAVDLNPTNFDVLCETFEEMYPASKV